MIATAVLFAVSASGLAVALDSVTNCSDTLKTDIEEVAQYISNHWDDFEDHLEAVTDMNIKKCMKNRFSKNGDVKCKDDTGACDCTPKKESKQKCAAAWATPTDKKIRLCPGFIDTISALDVQNRRACLAAIMAHEFGHSCDRFESGSEKVEQAAFDYWKSTHSAVTINKSSCGMD